MSELIKMSSILGASKNIYTRKLIIDLNHIISPFGKRHFLWLSDSDGKAKLNYLLMYYI